MNAADRLSLLIIFVHGFIEAVDGFLFECDLIAAGRDNKSVSPFADNKVF